MYCDQPSLLTRDPGGGVNEEIPHRWAKQPPSFFFYFMRWYIINIILVEWGRLTFRFRKNDYNTLSSFTLFFFCRSIHPSLRWKKGISIGAAVALTLAERHGRDVGFAYNRKEAKDHGEGGSLVGADLKVTAVRNSWSQNKMLRRQGTESLGGGVAIHFVYVLHRGATRTVPSHADTLAKRFARARVCCTHCCHLRPMGLNVLGYQSHLLQRCHFCLWSRRMFPSLPGFRLVIILSS